MAGFFQQFLKGAADGFFGSPYLKDFSHASKTFISETQAYSPKYKWLFHVYFDINKDIAGSNWEKVFPSTSNHGLLVKNIDLPRFEMKLDELNQYNRKRYVQTKISYTPVKITFHDDNSNIIKNLWQTYYNYHYYDTRQPDGTSDRARTIPGEAANLLNTSNIYNDNIDNQLNWGFNGDGGGSISAKTPFFRAIRIYGLSRHNFALYELINPIIQSFDHDRYDYYDTKGIMEHQMTVKYEAVKYYDGQINGQNPGDLVTRFGEESFYDKELSPISRDGSNRSILGQGGLVDAGAGILEDLGKGNILGAIQKAGRVTKTFKNTKQVMQAAKAELLSEVTSAATNATRGLFNLPAAGATTGLKSQKVNSGNSKTSEPPAVNNTPT